MSNRKPPFTSNFETSLSGGVVARRVPTSESFSSSRGGSDAGDQAGAFLEIIEKDLEANSSKVSTVSVETMESHLALAERIKSARRG